MQHMQKRLDFDSMPCPCAPSLGGACCARVAARAHEARPGCGCIGDALSCGHALIRRRRPCRQELVWSGGRPLKHGTIQIHIVALSQCGQKGEAFAPTCTERLEASDDRVVAVRDLGVATPDGARVLVSNLSFDLFEGQRLLLVGASGTGKSSVLRALAGLWP